MRNQPAVNVVSDTRPPLIRILGALGIETDADRKERHRLSLLEKKADQKRHERWAQHNATTWINKRECPCNTCVKARRYRR
jgi:hypothetical protein